MQILRKLAVQHCLSKKHTVSNKLDIGLGTGTVIKTNTIANFPSQFATSLFRNTFGNGNRSNTTRLSNSNDSLTTQSNNNQNSNLNNPDS